jgi:hypothetical protein
MLRLTYKAWLLLTFIFVVILPYFWAYDMSSRFDVGYSAGLRAFMPDIVMSLLALIGLIGLYNNYKYAIGYILIVALVLSPLLKLTMGGASFGAMAIGSVALIVSCILFKASFKKQCQIEK